VEKELQRERERERERDFLQNLVLASLTVPFNICLRKARTKQQMILRGEKTGVGGACPGGHC